MDGRLWRKYRKILDKYLVSYTIPNMNIGKVILDTNVVLSGLKSRNGSSFGVLEAVGSGKIDIAVSVPLVLEYESVLLKKLSPQILTEQEVSDFLDYLCSIGSPTKIYYLWRPILKDSYDDHILEVAVAAECSYIVTFNKKDFKSAQSFGIEAIEPRELLKIIGEIE